VTSKFSIPSSLRRPWWSTVGLILVPVIVLLALVRPAATASPKAEEFLKEIPEIKKQIEERRAERRKKNLADDQALCAKAKDPALCEMLATRLRGVEDKLLGIQVSLSDLSDIESAILRLQIAIENLQ
jgi:hypothetical protein